MGVYLHFLGPSISPPGYWGALSHSLSTFAKGTATSALELCVPLLRSLDDRLLDS